MNRGGRCRGSGLKNGEKGRARQRPVGDIISASPEENGKDRIFGI